MRIFKAAALSLALVLLPFGTGFAADMPKNGIQVSPPDGPGTEGLEGAVFEAGLYYNGMEDPDGSFEGMEPLGPVEFLSGDVLEVDKPGWYGLDIQDVLTDDYQYGFAPLFVHAGGGAAEAVLKPERSLRTGSIRIIKALSGYGAAKGDARFLFQVDAAKEFPDGTVATDSRMADMLFTGDGEQELVVDGLPFGADVTVTEVYAGAGYEVSGSGVQETVVSAGAGAVWFENEGVSKDSYGETVVNKFIREPDGWDWEPEPEPEPPVHDTPETGLTSRFGSFMVVALCLTAAAAIVYGIRKGGRWGKVFFGLIGICCLLGLVSAIKTFALPVVGTEGSLAVEVSDGRAIRESWSEGAKHVGILNILEAPAKVRARVDHAPDSVVEVLESAGWSVEGDGWAYYEDVLEPGSQTGVLDISVSAANSSVQDFEVAVSAELVPEGGSF